MRRCAAPPAPLRLQTPSAKRRKFQPSTFPSPSPSASSPPTSHFRNIIPYFHHCGSARLSASRDTASCHGSLQDQQDHHPAGDRLGLLPAGIVHRFVSSALMCRALPSLLSSHFQDPLLTLLLQAMPSTPWLWSLIPSTWYVLRRTSSPASPPTSI